MIREGFMDRKITENASKDKSELLISAASSNPDCEMWSDLSILGRLRLGTAC